MGYVFYKDIKSVGNWFFKLAQEEEETGNRPEGTNTRITNSVTVSLEDFQEFTKDVNNPNYDFSNYFTGKGFNNCLEIKGEHFPIFSVLLVRDEENNLWVSTKQTYFEPRARKIWGD